MWGIKAFFSEFSWQRRLLLVTVASVCLPFPVTVLCLIVTVLLLLCNKESRKRAFKSTADSIMWIFCGLTIIVPLCYGRYISLLAGFGLLVGFILFLFLKAWMTESLFICTIDATSITSISCFTIGVIQKIANGNGFRATGGLFNANYYGTVCEFIIIFIICRICMKPKSLALYIPLLIINVIGIFLCDCQSSWIAVMVGCVSLLSVFKGKRVALIAVSILVPLLIIGMVIPGLLPRLEYLPQSFLTRKNIWDTAWQMFLSHPLFGQGALTYWFSNELYGGYKTYHAHSLYLDPLISYGIVGVLLILTYVVMHIKRIVINFRGMISSTYRPIIAVKAGAIAAALVHGITDNTLLWIQTGILMIFVVSSVSILVSSDDGCDRQKFRKNFEAS